MDYQALNIEDVEIDPYCSGDRWTVHDIHQLYKLIAITVMGQAAYAASIIHKLSVAGPAFSNDDLCKEAINRLTLKVEGSTPKVGYPRIQRDGLIFEIVSWIAAKQKHGDAAYLKTPHTSATSQGLDGLMINVDPTSNEILQTTIFEDKCTQSPRNYFISNVLPEFLIRHENKRNVELISATVDLLLQGGFGAVEATYAAEKVLNKKFRSYRAAFVVDNSYDSLAERVKIFNGYEALIELDQAQRIGASFVVDGDMRLWFEDVAERAVDYLGLLLENSPDV